MTDRAPAAALLARHVHNVDRVDLHLFVGEGFFDGVLDLNFVGIRRHFEDVFALIAEHGALFGNDRANDGAVGVERAHSASDSALDSSVPEEVSTASSA